MTDDILQTVSDYSHHTAAAAAAAASSVLSTATRYSSHVDC